MILFKKRGFTDRLYFVNLAFAWVFTIVCIILTVLSSKLEINDLSIISVGMGVVWGELAIHTAFIIRKAWLENLSKHKNDLGEIKQVSDIVSEFEDISGEGVG